jgi:hypothetical protein
VTSAASLLPPNSTKLEQAIEYASQLDGIDPSGIKTLDTPAAIPSPLLPWLAWADDVLWWKNALSEAEKRDRTKASWNLHRRAGTLWAFKQAAKASACEVTRAIVPPAKIYPSPALTVAERNTFVARYPQLKIYRYRTIGQRIGLLVGDCLESGFPVISDAVLRMNPRAYLRKNGVDTELTIAERVTETKNANAVTVTITEAGIPGSADKLSFCAGHPLYLTVTEAAKRFYRLALNSSYLDSAETVRRLLALPDMTPIDIKPDAVAETGIAIGIYAGKFTAGYLLLSTARDRLYQRLYLFDPDIDVESRKVISHLNAGILGMPAFHAELFVSAPGKWPLQCAGLFVRGFLVDQAKTALTDCIDAMRSVARASERIELNLNSKKPAKASESNIAGQILSGAWA